MSELTVYSIQPCMVQTGKLRPRSQGDLLRPTPGSGCLASLISTYRGGKRQAELPHLPGELGLSLQTSGNNCDYRKQG